MKTIFSFIIGIPVICTFLISLIFFGIGIYETYSGLIAVFEGGIHTQARPGITLFQALDVFLIGFLFIIFSIGFAQLFVSNTSILYSILAKITPNWLKVESFTQLKLVLWDTVLTTLVVLFAGEAFRSLDGTYDWKLLFIPIAVLLIALSKFLIKRAKKA